MKENMLMELKKTHCKSAILIGIIILVLICPTSALNNSPEKTQLGQVDNHRLLEDVDVSGPGLPPANWNMINDASNYHISAESAEKTIDDVPALLWSYGCYGTSAAMLFGYYDRNGYQNIYTGPTNSGLFPLTSVWGPQIIDPIDNSGECPLSASHNGIDGRSTRGHADDYYYEYNSTTDPYFGQWTEHSPDSLGDFIGSNQYHNWANNDGETSLYYYSNNLPRYDPMPVGGRDGAHGMKLFAESRGYSVETVYNQRPAGFNGLPAGFTFAQYKSEIDNNRPVIISVTGHSMLGVGYSDPDQIIFHNTWDPDIHSMTWMGSYQGMAHRGVTVFHLTPINDGSAPTVTSITPSSGYNTRSVSITNLAGTNFATGATVLLTRSGFTNITASGVSVVSATQITCTLPLSGTTTGQYNVVVRNLDGKEGVLSNGFTIAHEPTSGGDGITIFRPSTGYWYFDYDLNGMVDNSFRYGSSTDQIINGDWQGTGTNGIAIFRPSTGYWYFDYNLDGTVNKNFRFGSSTDRIIKGNWAGTGDSIAIFRPSTGYWYFDYNLDGSIDKSFRFGSSTDQIIAGDWDGDGKDGIAIFRPSTGYWYFDYNLDGILNKSFRYGSKGDRIIVGKWQGTQDGIAIFRPSTGIWYFDYNLDGTVDKSFRYGSSTDQIIAGDWNGDGSDGIAIFRPSTGYWYFDYNLDGTVDKSFSYGSSTDRIITGKWV
jgi:hypothetical protein